MIWSVSTSSRFRTETPPWIRVIASIVGLLVPLADVDEVPLDGGRRGHLGGDEVGPPAAALAAFEVAVRRGRATLARLEDVGVHPEAHRTAGAAPFETGGLEDVVQPLRLRLGLHSHRAADHH